MRRTIALRKRYRAFGRGTIDFVLPDNSKVIAFVRTYEDEKILVVLNVSPFPQSAQLPLQKYRNYTPIELDSANPFPSITSDTYPITLNPFGYFWFKLQAQGNPFASLVTIDVDTDSSITLVDNWKNIFDKPFVDVLEKSILPKFFETEAAGFPFIKMVNDITVLDILALPHPNVVVAIIEILSTDGEKTLLTLPLGFIPDGEGEETSPKKSVLAKLLLLESEGVLVNALEYDYLVKHLAQLYEHKAEMRWRSGVLEVEHLERKRGEGEEQTNTPSESAGITQLFPDTVVMFDERHQMRLRRSLKEGNSINTEMLSVLNHRLHFFGVPKLWCTLSYKRHHGKRYEIASFETLPPNECSLLELLTEAIEHQTAGLLAMQQRATVDKSGLIFDDGRIVKAFSLLGKQIAALHNALAKEQSIEFAPEAFTMHYQRSIYQTLRSEIRQTIDLFEQKYSEKPEFSRHIQSLMNNEDRMLRLLKTIFDIPMQGKKIRLYGSRDLGTMFFTQDRIILTDFEGDTSRAINERRLKRSPLRDVAFLCHAIFRVIVTTVRRTAVVDTDVFSSNILIGMLYHHIENLFLESYLDTVDTALLPHTKEAIFPPLKAFALMRSFQTLREQIETDSNDFPDILPVSSAFSQLQIAESFSVF